MKNLFCAVLLFSLLGCTTSYKAFYLSRSLVSGIAVIGTSDCKAIILEKDNNFYICQFVIPVGNSEIYNLELIASGTYKIINDTLKLLPLSGEILKSKYILGKVENHYSSLSNLPGRLLDENGNGIEVRGPKSEMNLIESEIMKQIKRKLK